MEEHIIVMNSWRTSNSTITLKDFRLLGIDDGYKYVPKAHEIKPPFLKVVKLPERNMTLSIVTDNELFEEYHKLELMEGDQAVKQIVSQKKEKTEIMSKGSLESSTAADATCFADNSLKSNSDCDSMECNPDIESEGYYPQVQLYSPHEYDPDKPSYSLDTSYSSVTKEATKADISVKNDSDCDSMECNPDIESQELYPQVHLYSPHEYDPNMPSYSLDASSSSVKKNANMADISMKSDSDCDSMECNPDLETEEYYPQVKMYSPNEYNIDSPMQSHSFDGHNYAPEEYNPWKPDM